MFQAGAGPTGLHAYTDGALPGGVTVLFTIGDVNQVHLLVWTNNGVRDRCKWSSMFPRNMRAGQVCWYLLNQRDSANYTSGARLAGTGLVWPAINVGQSGETTYPEYPGGEAAVRAAVSGAAGRNFSSRRESGVEHYFLISGPNTFMFTNL